MIILIHILIFPESSRIRITTQARLLLTSGSRSALGRYNTDRSLLFCPPPLSLSLSLSLSVYQLESVELTRWKSDGAPTAPWRALSSAGNLAANFRLSVLLSHHLDDSWTHRAHFSTKCSLATKKSPTTKDWAEELKVKSSLQFKSGRSPVEEDWWFLHDLHRIKRVTVTHSVVCLQLSQPQHLTELKEYIWFLLFGKIF